jgi:D-beta-D-heptose 7-phosphate kinase/D-beta-D-heptose 1-phosphate adenosyltransferase
MIDNPVHRQTLAKIEADPRELAQRLDLLRGSKRIVLVKGVYDLLHVGHYYSFTNAKTLGDILVVAVNDDESVRQRKGRQRPILPLQDRMTLIAALACVDFVTTYSGSSPFEVISLLRPHVFAASHFNSLTECQRVALEGTVELQLVPKLGDSSTTALIQTIKGLPNA